MSRCDLMLDTCTLSSSTLLAILSIMSCWLSTFSANVITALITSVIVKGGEGGGGGEKAERGGAVRVCKHEQVYKKAGAGRAGKGGRGICIHAGQADQKCWKCSEEGEDDKKAGSEGGPHLPSVRT
mmetsp:Transcript_6883/g.17367  ORF Transcript_6883/g.17367 Transcript_6883/m.17367 type:complete len:126 (-) Transcript_6883:481-858(-)